MWSKLINKIHQYLEKTENTSQLIENEFRWILKVLHSCETLGQVYKTEKLFLILLRNYKVYFKSLGKKDLYKQILRDEFYSEMRNQIRKINKI